MVCYYYYKSLSFFSLQTLLIKDSNATSPNIGYKETINAICYSTTRFAIVKVFSLQFSQKLATQGEELQPLVIYVTHYQLVVLVNSKSDWNKELSIIGSLTANVM